MEFSRHSAANTWPRARSTERTSGLGTAARGAIREGAMAVGSRAAGHAAATAVLIVGSRVYASAATAETDDLFYLARIVQVVQLRHTWSAVWKPGAAHGEAAATGTGHAVSAGQDQAGRAGRARASWDVTGAVVARHSVGADVATTATVGQVGAEINRAASAAAASALPTAGERAGGTLVCTIASGEDAHGARRTHGRTCLGRAMAQRRVITAVNARPDAGATIGKRARRSLSDGRRPGSRDPRPVVVTEGPTATPGPRADNSNSHHRPGHGRA